MVVNSPVLWCGKKKQLIKYISQYYPTTINNYYEPFVGGGSVFFDIYTRKIVQGNYYISDLNDRLIRIYEVIRNDLNGLLNDLQKHCSNPNSMETYFYYIRSLEGTHYSIFKNPTTTNFYT